MQKESKSILIIMIVTVFSRILGFVREITLASTHGATIFTDAYLIAITIPVVIFTAVGKALSTTFIPLYSSITKDGHKEKGVDFTNNILNIVLLITILLTGFGAIFPIILVRIFAIGFEADVLDLATRFTKILLPAVIFIGLSDILGGYLLANKKYEAPSILGIPNNIIIIMSIILSVIWNDYILIYGTLLGIIMQFLFLLIYCYRLGFRYRFQIQFQEKNLKRLLYLFTPIFFSTALQQLNVIIDKTLASTLDVGSISALSYANKLNSFVYAIFATSIVTVIYPKFSDIALKEDKEDLKKTIKNSINIMLLLIIPISIGAICLNNPIVKLLFERGQFDTRATELTSTALLFYSVGTVGVSLRSILDKVFYSCHDTKTPMINGIFAILFNIILNFILIRYMKHGGLALATSISSTLGTILLFLSLRKKIGDFGISGILILAVKSLVSAIIMAAIILLAYNNIFNLWIIEEFISQGTRLILTIILGGVVYFILMAFMKVEEVLILISYFKKLKKHLNKNHS